MKKILSLMLALMMVLSLAVTVGAAETIIKSDASWEISASSDLGSTASLAFDGDTSTTWHTKYTVENGTVSGHDECPHTLTVNFGKEMTVSGFKYTPRQDNGTGTFLKYNVYASDDGNTFKLIYKGSFDYKPGGDVVREPKSASWGNVKMKAIMFEVTESLGGYGTAAEINFLTGGTGTAIKDGAAYSDGVGKGTTDTSQAGSVINQNANWKISTSSDLGGTIKNAFDGDTTTYWHTRYTGADGVVTSHDECPHTITVEFGNEVSVSGWLYTPRTDNATGTFLKYNVYKSTDGTNFEKIYTGSFDYTGEASKNKPMSASWGDTKMKAIKIEATDTIGGYGTALEIDFYTGSEGSSNVSGTTGGNASADGANVVKTENTWVMSTSSDLGGTLAKAFDGDTATYWHTRYSGADGVVTSFDECPHTIIVNFGKEMEISGWRYTPRTDNGTGTFLQYNIYKSTDGTNFEKIYTGAFEYGSEAAKNKPKSASWGNTKMKAIKIEVTDSLGGYGTAAEINFLTGGENDNSASNTAANGATIKGRAASDGTPFYVKTGWKATVNSENNAASTAQKALDNDVSTYWHTKYTADGPTITSHDNPPYHFIVTLPEKVTTSGIVLTPRTDNASGIITGADIYVSDSDDGEWFLLKKDMEFKANYLPKEITFTANLEIKRVWVEIKASHTGYGTLAEFDLMAKKDEFETVAYADYAANEEKNRLYEIDRSNVSVSSSFDSWASNIPMNLVDGGEDTFWQTEEVATYEWPVVLTFDLKSVNGIKEIRYLPRQTPDCHGTWLKVSVYGSVDNENWFAIKENLVFEKDTLLKYITLDEEVSARYVEFQIEESHASRVSGAEVTFWQSKDAKDKFDLANSEKYTLKIGSDQIESEKAGVKSSVTMDVVPEIVNGSTMIPLRGLLEQMGASVTWDGASETITVDNGRNVIKLQIWNYHVYVYGTAYGDLRYTLLNPPIIKNSRTLIPVRFVSEHLGYTVDWDGATQTITITR